MLRNRTEEQERQLMENYVGTVHSRPDPASPECKHLKGKHQEPFLSQQAFAALDFRKDIGQLAEDRIGTARSSL